MFSGKTYKQPTISTQVPQSITNRQNIGTPLQNTRQSNLSRGQQRKQKVISQHFNDQQSQSEEILDLEQEYLNKQQIGVNYEDLNDQNDNQLEQIKEDSIINLQQKVQSENQLQEKFQYQQFENDSNDNSLQELHNQIQDYKMVNTHCIVALKPIRENVKQSEKQKFQIYYSEIEDKLQTIAQMRSNDRDKLPENLAIVERTLYQTLDKTKNINKELQQIYRKERYQKDNIQKKQQYLLTIEERQQKEIEKEELEKQLQKTIESYQQLQKFTFDKNLAVEYDQQQKQEQQALQEEKMLYKLKHNPDPKEEKDKQYKILNVIKKSQLEKKVAQAADKIKQYGEYNKKINYAKIKRSLINQLMIYKRLDLKISDVIRHKIFYKQPYEREKSKLLFTLIKQNDLQSVDRVLRENKFHVYDYDTCYETPLHWACKRGHFLIVQMLLDYKAFIDAKDHIGRTPLFFAIREGHSKIVQFLLLHKASPWNEGKCNYDQYIQSGSKISTETRIMYKTAKKIHLLLYLCPQHKQDEMWNRMVYIFEQDQLAYRAGDKKLGQ